MSAAPDGTGSLVASQTGSWLTGAAQRISAGNTPGNRDGLFASHALADTPVADLTWDVNPISEQWLEENRHPRREAWPPPGPRWRPASPG